MHLMNHENCKSNYACATFWFDNVLYDFLYM